MNQETPRIIRTDRDDRHPEWVMGGDPDAIVAQEQRGQEEFVRSAQLPTDIAGKEILEAAGIVFGEPHEKDPLFCDAVLPPGWTKRATEHSMWSELLDEHGRVRATIFYKAAFYDRRAFLRAVRE